MNQYEITKLLDCDLQKCVMAGPLSRSTTFALHITGPYGVEECEHVIQMLELQKTWLVAGNVPAAEAAK